MNLTCLLGRWKYDLAEASTAVVVGVQLSGFLMQRKFTS